MRSNALQVYRHSRPGFEGLLRVVWLRMTVGVCEITSALCGARRTAFTDISKARLGLISP